MKWNEEWNVSNDVEELGELEDNIMSSKKMKEL